MNPRRRGTNKGYDMKPPPQRNDWNVSCEELQKTELSVLFSQCVQKLGLLNTSSKQVLLEAAGGEVLMFQHFRPVLLIERVAFYIARKSLTHSHADTHS